MILRTKRHRTIMGFVAGFILSSALLGAAMYYYIISQSGKIQDIKNEAISEYLENNPTSVIYVFATDKKAGDVLSDSDLTISEIKSQYLPTDAVTEITDAIGKVVRCDVKANTAVTMSLIYDEGNYPDDLRLMEYSVVNLPQKLEPRQFIDIRVMFPNGLDYIVLSKKQVIDLARSESDMLGTIWLHCGEEEILRMSSAIVDASIVDNAYLYAVPYIAPDIQKEAITNYSPNKEVIDLIKNNPNIVKKAITELESRNRKLLEELVNKYLEEMGKRKVYGSDTTVNHIQQNYNNPTTEAATQVSSPYSDEGRL